MKAIVMSEFGDESVLQYREKDMPEPGANEVRICMGAAGVNPVETYIRSGNYGSLPSLPYTPGNDGAGVVDAVGSDVDWLKPGQRVFVAASLAANNTGTYAEYAVCDASAVHPLPKETSFAEGAGLGTPGLAAAFALFSGPGLRPGDTVLVHGATGGVGTLAVQLARQAGAIVMGTSGSKDGEDLLRDLGAHHVFNHRAEGYLEEIRAAGSPNVIVEVLANVNLTKDLSVIAKNGRVMVVGNRGSLEFNPRDTMVKNASVHGILVNNMTAAIFRENMYRLGAALENGLRVIIERELPLQDAPQAHKLVMGDNKAGKIILTADAK